MAELLPVPEVAAGATEVLLSEWLVQPGTALRVGQPIAVVETDKAIVEIEVDREAVLLRQLIEPGTTVEVGSAMALLGSEAEADADLDALLAELGVLGGVPDQTAVHDEVPQSESESPAPGQDPAPQHQPAALAQDLQIAQPSGRTFISPIARRLLRDAGLSADSLDGSGPGGRIVRRDVERLIAEHRSSDAAASAGSGRASGAEVQSGPGAGATTAHQPPAEPSESVEGGALEPHSRMRRAIANRLSQSKREVPHFYVKRTVRLDPLLRLREELNTQLPVRISVNDLIVRAVAAAHLEVPDANVVWTEEGLRRFESVDVAVAIASERGLVTPVLRSVERTSVSAVSRQIKGFVESANAGRLQQRDLEGGTISVTNLGMYGVDEFAAIINPPHSAILAVGAGKASPVVVDEGEGPQVRVETTMQLVLSVDHRAIDGALAAQWLGALVHVLEHPLALLA